MSKPTHFRLKTPVTKETVDRLVKAGFIPVVRWVTRKKPYECLTTQQAKKKLEVN
jgi:hypothetical protein